MNSVRKTQFFTQLATMTKGGLPLSQAFAALAENFHEPLVGSIRQSIEDGNSLELAFDREEFSSFEQSCISAGNQTGQLAASFAALANYWQRETDLTKAVRQSLIYPVVMLHLSILVGPIGLIMQKPVQYGTTVLIDFACLYLGVYFLYLLVRSIWRLPDGQVLLLKVPLIGSFWKSVYLLRWMLITQMEFNAGLGMPHAVSDAWKGTGLGHGEAYAQRAESELLAGSELSQLMKEWPLFPKEWRGYLVAGETSGQMAGTLKFLAEESEKEYGRRSQLLQDLLPKFLCGVILVIVGIQIAMDMMNVDQEAMKQLDTIEQP